MHSSILKCPVCHMNVEKGSFFLEYEGLSYAFCSEQCQERFVANPHLYVGRAGQPALKQQGHEIIRQHVLRLREPLSEDQQARLTRELQMLMGLKSVRIENTRIRLRYDLLQVTAEQIEKKIEAVGDRLGGGLGEMLRRAFVHAREETELDSLESRSGDGPHHRH